MQNLDELDRKILRLLQTNAKTTTKELAAELNLTVSPVYDRVKRLENMGYIKNYVAVLDKNMLNRSATTFCQVSMKQHSEEFIEEFEHEIKQLEEVQECYHMAGQIDFLLKINVSSIDEYHNFIRYKLTKINNIAMLNSMFVLKEIKHTHVFSI